MSEACLSPFERMRPTESTRAAKRTALLQAAVHMFNERGFYATSLDEVATAVGVTKPVIYHYLGTKDQVLFECVRIGLAELQAAADEARSIEGRGIDRLRVYLCRYAEIIMSDFGSCVIRTGDEALTAGSRAEFRRLKREVDGCLREMIAQAAADGSASVTDVRMASLAIAGALNWSARWFQRDGAATATQMAQALVASTIRGIERPDER